MDSDGLVVNMDEPFMWDWVRIFEVVQEDNTKTLEIEHSPDCDAWKLQGMLQAAADYYRTMTTNIFFGQDDTPWAGIEECDGCEDCDDD
jgi:hypothetical protein